MRYNRNKVEIKQRFFVLKLLAQGVETLPEMKQRMKRIASSFPILAQGMRKAPFHFSMKWNLE